MPDPTDPPAHLGRVIDAETGYALVCGLTVDGDPDTGTICGKPAAWHLRWDEDTTENGFTCAPHLAAALGFYPHDRHTLENSACGIRGSCWVPGDPSHCTMLALDETPDRSGHVQLEVGNALATLERTGHVEASKIRASYAAVKACADRVAKLRAEILEAPHAG